MSKSAVYIFNLKVLYNIIFEIKNFFNFDLFYNESEKSIFEEQKKRGDKSFIIITHQKLKNDSMSDDDAKIWSDEIQELTNQTISMIDKSLEEKQSEIMQI